MRNSLVEGLVLHEERGRKPVVATPSHRNGEDAPGGGESQKEFTIFIAIFQMGGEGRNKLCLVERKRGVMSHALEGTRRAKSATAKRNIAQEGIKFPLAKKDVSSISGRGRSRNTEDDHNSAGRKRRTTMYARRGPKTAGEAVALQGGKRARHKKEPSKARLVFALPKFLESNT